MNRSMSCGVFFFFLIQLILHRVLASPPSNPPTLLPPPAVGTSGAAHEGEVGRPSNRGKKRRVPRQVIIRLKRRIGIGSEAATRGFLGRISGSHIRVAAQCSQVRPHPDPVTDSKATTTHPSLLLHATAPPPWVRPHHPPRRVKLHHPSPILPSPILLLPFPFPFPRRPPPTHKSRRLRLRAVLVSPSAPPRLRLRLRFAGGKPNPAPRPAWGRAAKASPSRPLWAARLPYTTTSSSTGGRASARAGGTSPDLQHSLARLASAGRSGLDLARAASCSDLLASSLPSQRLSLSLSS
jgi:hypothetical protein